MTWEEHWEECLQLGSSGLHIPTLLALCVCARVLILSNPATHSVCVYTAF